MPELNIRGKTAIVTGGSSGLGKSIAKHLIRCGIKVVITGRSEKELSEAAREIGASYIIWDISSVNTIQDNILKCERLLGAPIEILVNNAGVYRPLNLSKLLSLSEKTYDEIMDINLKGTYFMMQQFIQYMIDKGIKGNVLNISSASTYELTYGPYSLSKLGVTRITQAFGKFFSKTGIVVNGIAPGVLATRMNGWVEGNPLDYDKMPTGKMITVEEVSNLALYLLSDSATQIIGETILIDGAWSIRKNS